MWCQWFEIKKNTKQFSSPGEQAPMNPTNPNGIPLEPTKGCDLINPQRFLAYVLCIFMLCQLHEYRRLIILFVVLCIFVYGFKFGFIYWNNFECHYWAWGNFRWTAKISIEDRFTAG